MGVPIIGSVMKKVFGTRNERMVKRYLQVVDQVSQLEPQIRMLTDAELRAKTDEFRERVRKGEKARDMIPEIFAVGREAMDRSVGIRNIFNPEAKFDPSALPPDVRALYDEVQKTISETEPREPLDELLGNTEPVPAWQFVDIPNAIYEAVRELHPKSRPPFRARPFDVQIIGGMVLSEGRIAEMKTGEGKTIVAPLASYLACLEGMQVHVVTVNDYLVQRDRDWTFPFFRALGLTVGAIHPHHMQPPQMKALAYACDVLYGTTSEFGFDYLRDNMKLSVQEQVQKRREFAIVDEVDSILIDEARTPLIISGSAHAEKPRYDLADTIASQLVERQRDWDIADQKVQSCLVEISTLEGDIRNARVKGEVPEMKSRLDEARKRLPGLEAERDKFTQFYEIEMDKKRANLTHAGISEAQKIAGIGSFYVGDNVDVPHLLEQAIRARTVYQRDRDYVVIPQDGEQSIVIVDQNTGRIMPGRQWSDGLHQAIEAKEGVKIKEETQTMATITIQNFFKQYKRLAGMTGTADTEATEFHEIYKLDVISIPTNVPIARVDRNDLVYISAKDKWDAIVDEIKTFHDIGRPVLVGTTSVEKSELLGDMLAKKHQIKHEILNAKQHDREAEIIANAGGLGAVMIATNMAGRGTDIKLGRFTPEQLIDHWKRRSLAPRQVTAEMPEEEIVRAIYRHIAPRELDLRKPEVEPMSDAEIRSALFQSWAMRYLGVSERKAASMSEEAISSALDATGSCILHRLRLFGNVEDLGGLHVVGTERHEARRIDNQLRGRSGRQGDRGSSRFFLSMEDDLMKMFAGETTLKFLSRMGMKAGDAIEHPMLSRAVEKAQRKVEERNFLWRKNILEYDEIMNVQRGEFYGLRQTVLEGDGIKDLIFEQIDNAVTDAAELYLDKLYVPNCISEWVREQLHVSIEPERFKGKDREDLHKVVRVDAKEDTASMIDVTLGEYLPEDTDPADWDYKGLVDWANPRFSTQLKVSEIREWPRTKIQRTLEETSERRVDAIDLAPLDQFLVPRYGEKELANWSNNKFGSEFKPEQFEGLEDAHDAVEMIMAEARRKYLDRERTYPVEFALDMTTANLQRDPRMALTQLASWAKLKYGLDWTADGIAASKPVDIRDQLLAEAAKWNDARIRERADEAARNSSDVDALDAWFREHYASRLTDTERERAANDIRTTAEEKTRAILRSELTQFERWILLQIFDQAWKDHLHAMDQVKESIGFRAFSQRDPRIEYKREGSRLFTDMQKTIREKVTDLIFKAKLSPQVASRPAQQPPMQAQQPQPGEGPGQPPAQPPTDQRQPAPPRAAQSATAAAAALARAEAANREAAASAQDAGSPRTATKVQPRRVAPTVGRNEPCPCGSGKKFKQCCGKK